MRFYIPSFNDEVLCFNDEFILPNKKVIELVELLFSLDKRYKIEKIISFNKEDYQEELKQIFNNKNMELHNHYIDSEEGYFHITFEKELIKDDNLLTYDKYCPYAISLIVKGNIDYQKYISLFNKKISSRDE
ncbi:MAG: hypothetical protein E7177_02735 [Erysipelotrichaceae bacterium]|nr:hypothetical protein [Erysipelotrichaceae bacterium]